MEQPLKSGWGGPRPGQGRKPGTGPKLTPRAIRLNDNQALKLSLLGGSAWVREQIEKAPAPPGFYSKVASASAEDLTVRSEQPTTAEVKAPGGATIRVSKQLPVGHLPPDQSGPDRPF